MIYYFTGTGNTRYAAEKAAAFDGDAVLYAPDVISGRAVAPLEGKTNVIGFFFPTYFFGLPVIAEQLLKVLSLSAVHGRYIYLVLTCGSTTGGASRQMSKLLKKYGCELSACYSVRMPDNYVPMFKIDKPETIRKTLDNADAALSQICESIHNRETGDHDRLKGVIPPALTAMSYPLYLRGRKTEPFHASADCTGCGKCARECPVSAISIEDGLPVWTAAQCVFCMRCLHSCPVSAIDYGTKTRARGRYTNPNVK